MIASVDARSWGNLVIGSEPLTRFCLQLMVLVGVGLSSATVLADERAIETAGDALGRSFPWYDRGTDGLQRIDVAPPQDVPNRHSRWEARDVDWDLPNLPQWFFQLLEVLVWVAFAALIAVVVYLMVRTFLSADSRPISGSSARLVDFTGDAERVERLPFKLEPRQINLLEEARRLYEQGQFDEAIVYLYSYQLLALDKHQLIRLTQGKTNRQYLREARRRPVIQSLLERTMIAFEDVFFGDHSLDRSRFESCWSHLEQFHTEIQKAPA